MLVGHLKLPDQPKAAVPISMSRASRDARFTAAESDSHDSSGGFGHPPSTQNVGRHAP